MGIEITDADMDRLFAGSNEAEPSGSNEVKTEEAPAPEPDAAPQVETATEEPETGHNVPYSRFSKVIASRNEAQEKLSGVEEKVTSLQRELEEAKRFRSFMEQMQPQQSAQPAVTQAEDDYLDPVVAQRFNALQQQYEQLAYNRDVDVETQNVLREVQHAVASNPGVPEEAFYEALNRDPNADLNAFGAMYSQRLAEIEEGAIARYLAENKAAPDVPPEVGSQTGRRSSGQADTSKQSWQDSLDKLFGLT